LIVVRFAEAERQAECQFRENVTAQKQRDAVGVTKLSAEAAAALEAVHAARTEQPGESWYIADTRDRAAGPGSGPAPSVDRGRDRPVREGGRAKAGR
jgi:microcystin degradation protein MlrC